MKIISTVKAQSKNSRLMRVGILLWAVWAAIALGGAITTVVVAIIENMPENLLWTAAFIASIPAAGLFFWFLAAGILWVKSPTE